MKKAFPSLQDSWIKECLEMYKIGATLRNFLFVSSTLWIHTLTLMSNNESPSAGDEIILCHFPA